MASHCDHSVEPAVSFDCGCFVGIDGGTYCCPLHYDLVGLLHTQKHRNDPLEWSAARDAD